jgi:capsular exopolysaccharide synthesis family protein
MAPAVAHSERRPPDRPLHLVSEVSESPDGEDRISIGKWLTALRRRKILALSLSATLLAGSAVCIFQMPDAYTSTAVVKLETRRAPLGDFQSVMPAALPDPSEVRSEIEVIRSDHTAEAVVNRLGLDRNPRFNGHEVDFWTSVHDQVRSWMSKFRLLGQPQRDTAGQDADHLHAIDRVLSRLNVLNDGHSYVVKIRFSDRDRELAASVANAFADVYLQQQVGLKNKMAGRLDGWLGDQIAELRQLVNDSDRAVQAYREQHGLYETRGATVVAQQLNELNSELISASGDRARKEAHREQIERLQNGEESGIEGAMLASPLIQRLREQEAEVSRREQDLRAYFLPRYPAVQRAAAEHADILAKLQQEVRKLATNAETELRTARAREAALREKLSQLEAATADDGKASVRLHELERDAEANRTLLENMLLRARETSAQKSFVLADARLVSEARIPLLPSFPRRGLLLGLCGTLSMMTGAIAAISAERRRRGFRTEAELQTISGLPTFGVIPFLRRRDRRPRNVVNGPILQAEPFNFVRSMLRGARLNGSGSYPKLILVTSSVAGEGKTFFASTLAQSLAQANNKCLLVDCDLRNPSVAGLLELDARRDAYCSVDSLLTPIGPVLRDISTALDFVAPETTAHPQRVLESPRFRNFIAAARERYDVVILDAPPVFPVADALHLSTEVDAILFVVEWERTPRSLVQSALSVLSAAGGQLLGAVLTKVDLRKHAKYGCRDRAYCYVRYGTSHELQA